MKPPPLPLENPHRANTWFKFTVMHGTSHLADSQFATRSCSWLKEFDEIVVAKLP